jgi:protein-tyrosine kinase
VKQGIPRMNDMSQPPPAGGEPLRSLVADARRRDRSIGAILIDAGRLTIANAERVLQAQRRMGLRFGEAAVKLGLITQEDVHFALSRQFDSLYLPPGDGPLSAELVAAYHPFGKQTESIRALRSQLLLRWLGDEPARRSVALVSAGRKEGRTRLAANLAVVFSLLGERTLLIDGDLRNPRVHALFSLDNARGLSSALADRGEPAIHRIPALLSLYVLPAGPIAPNPQELLSRSNFVRLLDEQRERFDVVILDTPAADQSADAYLLAARAGAAVVLARRNTTRYSKLQQLADRLLSSRATLIGSVFNDF